MADEKAVLERRNFLLNLLEGVLYATSLAFVSVQTVLPALVARLGGSPVTVGALAVISWGGLFIPQVFAAKYVERIPWKKPWSVLFGAAQRVVLFFIPLSLLLYGQSDPERALSFLVVLFALNQLLLGITTPGWFDLYAKLTPVRRRGRLSGLRSSIGGVGGLLGGILISSLVATYAFPIGYVLIFSTAFVLQSLSILIQLALKESEPSVVVPPRSLVSFLTQLPAVIRANSEFRRFLISSAFLIVASVPVGFFTVYALDVFDAPESTIGEFTVYMVSAQVISSLVNGFLADRYGYKLVLVLAAGSMLCATVLALLASTLEVFMLTFVLAGVSIGTEVMSRYNISIEYGPPTQRSMYIGLMNTVLAPLYLSGLLAGVVVQEVGFEWMFGLAILSSLIGLALLVFVVKDPRSLPETG